MNIFEFSEFYFLTDLYNKQIDELFVAKLFVLKYIAILGRINEDLISIRKNIYDRFNYDIPHAVLDTSIEELSHEYKFIQFNSKFLIITETPEEIITRIEQIDNNFNIEGGLVFHSFQEFLKNNRKSISYDEYKALLNSIRDRIIEYTNDKRSTNFFENLFYEFITIVFNSENNQKLKIALNKLLFSLLFFTYYTGIKNNKYIRKKIVLDTNILVYALGINGLYRKKFAEEFFNMAQESECSFIVSIETIEELKRIIESEPNDEIKLFKINHKSLSLQLIKDPLSLIKKYFNSNHLEYRIKESTIEESKPRFDQWEKLYRSLEQYKTDRKRGRNEKGFDHDINLIFIAEIYKKLINFDNYEKSIVTADLLFVDWFKKKIKEDLNNDNSNIISLDKFILFLWQEGKNNNSSKFLPKAWFYISDSISYFNDLTFDVYYKSIREELKDLEFFSDNWRSAYIMMRESISKANDLNNEEPSLTQVIDQLKTDIKTYILDTVQNNAKKTKDEINQLIDKVSFIEGEKDMLSHKISKKDIELINTQLKVLEYQKDVDFKKDFERSPFSTAIDYYLKKYPWMKIFLKILKFLGYEK